MLWVYAGALLVMMVLAVWSRNFRRAYFKTLDKKNHPLRVLYPMAGWILAVLERFTGKKGDKELTSLMRSLYVKENVEQEKYLYRLRKISTVLAVLTGTCTIGILFCLGNEGNRDIHVLQRSDYGQPPVTYDLDMEYRRRKDTVTLPIEAVHYSESEILELFENSYEEVKTIMLSENEDQEHVTKPLNLIREHSGFSIYWEVDDPDTVNYNGQIKKEPREGEAIVCNLMATFSLDDVSSIYNYPIRICSPEISEQEYLLASIKKSVEQENDIHEKDVKLPDEIDGYAVRFFRESGQAAGAFFILAILAAILIALMYDQRLKERLKKRQDQMMMDFAEIVSKLSLLYEAGLSIHGSFDRILQDYETRLKRMGKEVNASGEDYHYAYREMKLALEKIRSGESEGKAYAGFGKRCALQPYIRLGNLLEQNLHKGAKGMQELLLKEVQSAQEERKRIARKKGEEASTRLLIPMGLMLIVVIAIITVPALVSISG